MRSSHAAVRRYGRIDILVCNAGVNVKKKAIDFTAAEFDTVIGGNLRSYFLCAQAAARQFIAPGQRRRHRDELVQRLRRRLRGPDALLRGQGRHRHAGARACREWGPHGIRVNAFNPGYTKHSMTAEGQAYLAEAETEIAARTPLRRMAEMKEMVGPAVFLASDAASFVTGTILLADGGWCAQ